MEFDSIDIILIWLSLEIIKKPIEWFKNQQHSNCIFLLHILWSMSTFNELILFLSSKYHFQNNLIDYHIVLNNPRSMIRMMILLLIEDHSLFQELFLIIRFNWKKSVIFHCLKVHPISIVNRILFFRELTQRYLFRIHMEAKLIRLSKLNWNSQ